MSADGHGAFYIGDNLVRGEGVTEDIQTGSSSLKQQAPIVASPFWLKRMIIDALLLSVWAFFQTEEKTFPPL